ncbi:MAG: cell division protein SepF [Phascolarctobacterium sp.]|nr:cell division protein SepF [Phascolarctobacterium sp.]
MSFINEILDAIGLYEEEDIDEELDAARESKKARSESKRIEKGPFAKAQQEEKKEAKPKSIKEIYEDDGEDDEEDEKSSIFSFPFFGKKKKEDEELKAEAPKKAVQESAKSEVKEARKPFFRDKAPAKAQAPHSEVVREEAPKRSFLDRFRSKSNDSKDANGNHSMPITVRNKEINVMVIEPSSFDDCPKIADYLRNNQPVVINFEALDPLVAKRMADFICGSVYAINGSMKKIGRSILICAPRNVDIDAAAQYDVGEEEWKK